jgi:hypothetical protein
MREPKISLERFLSKQSCAKAAQPLNAADAVAVPKGGFSIFFLSGPDRA